MLDLLMFQGLHQRSESLDSKKVEDGEPYIQTQQTLSLAQNHTSGPRIANLNLTFSSKPSEKAISLQGEHRMNQSHALTNNVLRLLPLC